MLATGYFGMLWESQMSRTEIKYYHQQYLHKNPNGYCGLPSASSSGVELALNDRV